MPLNAIEATLLEPPAGEDLDNHQRLDYAPRERDKIGKWTVIALILNRTIGSGIFTTPGTILAGTGCVGGALCAWVLGGLLSICGLYVWLECGLSMPQRRVRGENEPRGVPRSGGEKNFLEFMFPNDRLTKSRPTLPHIRTTCSFAIMFLLMYNLTGNAMSFGYQVMLASKLYDSSSSEPPDRGTVIGIAIASLSFVILMHAFSRRMGIWINNFFAILKVALLLAIVCLGIAKAAGKFGGPGEVLRENFTQDVWKTQRKDVGSWSSSLMFCMYTFSGYEQPFYVLAETKSPRKYFPRYTVVAMLIAVPLFVMVNVSYLLVVNKNQILPQGPHELPETTYMATLFFKALWENDHESAERAMAAVTAVAIFGNLWVMTFTAARVKQEIAKEGILPFSLQIATSYRTPWGILKKWFRKDAEVEQAPTAAFLLHWVTSVFLLGATAAIKDPRTTYSVLVYLYSYTIIVILGIWVSTGLILTKLCKEKFHWQERRRYRPWLSPAHVIIYLVATTFMMAGAFIPPTYGSPFHSSVTNFTWYIIPTISITAPFWGVVWYRGFLLYERFVKDGQLVVTREAYWIKDPDFQGEYIQLAEIIDHSWEVGLGPGGMSSAFDPAKESMSSGHDAASISREHSRNRRGEDSGLLSEAFDRV